jgi:metal-responsive CopG/Arc/MetJ family transcriptional regulator
MANRQTNTKNKIVRASVSFSQDDYLNLEDIAKKKKVSIAWVVREAVEKYLINQQDEQKKKHVLE